METVSCHSDESTWTTAIKNIIFDEANVMNSSVKFQLHPPYGFWGDDFQIFFRKGLGLQTHLIGPVNWQKIKVSERKWYSTFLFAEHFYFHEKHLFSFVNPLFLCYRMPNLGRVAIFDVFWSFLHLWSQIWQGAQPPYKIKFWQCWDFIIPYKVLCELFVRKLCPYSKIEKFDFSC